MIKYYLDDDFFGDYLRCNLFTGCPHTIAEKQHDLFHNLALQTCDEGSARYDYIYMEYKNQFMKGLRPIWTGKPRVIFGRLGTVTLQLPLWDHQCFARTFNDIDAGYAGRMAAEYFNEPSIMWTFKGHDESSIFEPKEEQLLNHEYRIWEIGTEPIDTLWWVTVNSFYQSYFAHTERLNNEKKLFRPIVIKDDERPGISYEIGEKSARWNDVYCDEDPYKRELVIVKSKALKELILSAASFLKCQECQYDSECDKYGNIEGDPMCCEDTIYAILTGIKPKGEED